MGELLPTFRYTVAQGKKISELNITLDPPQLPTVFLKKESASQTIQSVPYSVLLHIKECYLHVSIEKDLSNPIKAREVYIEVPEAPDPTSWVLPLFYYATNSLGIPTHITFSENHVNQDRRVTRMPRGIKERASDMLAVIQAIQYFH